MAKYGLFLGCIAPLRYPGIETSTMEVAKALELDMVLLDGTSCCPAPGVFRSFHEDTWLALGSRNLALAKEKGLEIVTICNGCFGSLAEVADQIERDKEKKEYANSILKQIGKVYDGGVKVRQFAELLYTDVGLNAISEKVKNKLGHIKAAVHYGCHYFKPEIVKQIDNRERPKTLDELVETTGATTVDYRNKNLCCGAGGGVRARAKDVAQKMTNQKLESIKESEANCIIDICPFCHLQFDQSQQELGTSFPVIHLSQLLVLAFDLDKSKLGFDAHSIPVEF
ncbi:MAG: CoB--CoM heterodisulfide reductase subunit B [Thermoplasmata archaeon]